MKINFPPAATSRIFGRLCAVVGTRVTSLLDRGRGLLASKRFKEAAASFKQALATDPACREAQEGLNHCAAGLMDSAERALQAGQEKAFRTFFCQAFEALPADPAIIARMKRHVMHPYAEECGNDLLAGRNFKPAMMFFQLLLEIDPKYDLALAGLNACAAELLALARKALEEHREEAFRTYLSLAFTANPTNPAIYERMLGMLGLPYARGLVSVSVQPPAAAPALAAPAPLPPRPAPLAPTAVKLPPPVRNPAVIALLAEAKIHFDGGRITEALPLLETALKLDPNNIEAVCRRGLCDIVSKYPFTLSMISFARFSGDKKRVAIVYSRLRNRIKVIALLSLPENHSISEAKLRETANNIYILVYKTDTRVFKGLVEAKIAAGIEPEGETGVIARVKREIEAEIASISGLLPIADAPPQRSQRKTVVDPIQAEASAGQGTLVVFIKNIIQYFENQEFERAVEEIKLLSQTKPQHPIISRAVEVLAGHARTHFEKEENQEAFRVARLVLQIDSENAYARYVLENSAKPKPAAAVVPIVVPFDNSLFARGKERFAANDFRAAATFFSAAVARDPLWVEAFCYSILCEINLSPERKRPQAVLLNKIMKRIEVINFMRDHREIGRVAVAREHSHINSLLYGDAAYRVFVGLGEARAAESPESFPAFAAKIIRRIEEERIAAGFPGRAMNLPEPEPEPPVRKGLPSFFEKTGRKPPSPSLPPDIRNRLRQRVKDYLQEGENAKLSTGQMRRAISNLIFNPRVFLGGIAEARSLAINVLV